MTTNDLWASFWKTLGCVVSLAILVGAGCSARETTLKTERDALYAAKVAEMVRDGANPIEAACSLGLEQSKDRCLVIAATRKP